MSRTDAVDLDDDGAAAVAERAELEERLFAALADGDGERASELRDALARLGSRSR